MTNEEQSNFLEKLTVKIKSPFKSGSGIIIKNSEPSNLALIFTATHTFFQGEEHKNKECEQHEKDDFFAYPISDTDIIFYPKYKSKYLSLADNSLYVYNNKDADFSILLIHIDENLSDTPTTELFIDDTDTDYYPYEQFVICGFPTYSENSDNNDFDYHYATFKQSLHPQRLKVQLKSEDSFCGSVSIGNQNHYYAGRDFMIGMSGGGVFINEKNKLYLFGLKNGFLGSHIFSITSISPIYHKIQNFINSKLKTKFPDKKISSISIKDSFINLTLSNIEILEKELEKEHPNYRNEERSLEIFEATEKENIKKEKLRLEKELGKVAIRYVEWAVFFHKIQDYKRSTIYFNNAIKLNKKYQKILLQLQLERTDLKKEEKRKTTELLIENEKSILAEEISDEQKIASLDQIIELKQNLQNSNQETEDLLRQLLLVLSNSSNLSTSNEKQSSLDKTLSRLTKIIEEKYKSNHKEKLFQLGEIYTEAKKPNTAYGYYWQLRSFLIDEGNVYPELLNVILEKIEQLGHQITIVDKIRIEHEAGQEIAKIAMSSTQNQSTDHLHHINEIKNIISDQNKNLDHKFNQFLIHTTENQNIILNKLNDTCESILSATKENIEYMKNVNKPQENQTIPANKNDHSHINFSWSINKEKPNGILSFKQDYFFILSVVFILLFVAFFIWLQYFK